jgi:diacylglycerol kinase family enzyme/membrane-associated phospholipid phosphatase
MPNRPVPSPRVALRRIALLPSAVRRVDARVGRRINTRRTLPAVDLGYARLSRAADRSVLWFAIALVLVVTGQHRAALRGAASLATASALANLVGKQLFGGDRPLLKDIPIGRRLRTSPTSPSFPSGHAASAAGFVTGVALESPRTGLALVPAAVAVAYSRLHTGAHWFSDVIGGAIIGAAVAAAGSALVPARPAPRAAERLGGMDIALPAIADGAGVFVVVNSSSGVSVLRPDAEEYLADHLPAARVHRLREEDDLELLVRDALAAAYPPRVLGVSGGDGTVSAVADVARLVGLPLLVLPGGTFNHFARTAGVGSYDDAMEALAAGEGVRVDVGELQVADTTRVTVLNAASVGVYPDFVATRERLQARLDKWAAGVVAAVLVTRRAEPVDVVVNGRRLRVWSLFVGVNRNHPDVVAPLQRRRLGDGLLDVRVLHGGPRLRAAASLAFGRRTSAVLRRLRLLPDDAVEAFTTASVTAVVRPTGNQPTGFAHDGEVSLDVPGDVDGGFSSTVRVVPGGLDVYSPSRARTGS